MKPSVAAKNVHACTRQVPPRLIFELNGASWTVRESRPQVLGDVPNPGRYQGARLVVFEVALRNQAGARQ